VGRLGPGDRARRYAASASDARQDDRSGAFRQLVWAARLAPRAACAAEPDMRTIARDQLARAAEFVPVSIPLMTVLLGADTSCALHGLAAANGYDLLVISGALPDHSHRLRREMRRLHMCVLRVSPEPTSEDLIGHRAVDALIH